LSTGFLDRGACLFERNGGKKKMEKTEGDVLEDLARLNGITPREGYRKTSRRSVSYRLDSRRDFFFQPAIHLLRAMFIIAGER